jgi:Fungalysin metallopeptidase (M36)/PKD domain/Fungalysin/Thermolysin Propeptide Motif
MRRVPVLVVGCLLAVCIVTVAQAASVSTTRVWSLADRDVRSTSDSQVSLTARQQHALRAMRGVTVRTNDWSGTPSSVIRYGGFLTRPSAAAPAAIALGYLADHVDLFRLSRADLTSFAVATKYVTEHNGATQLTLQQLDQGRKIEGALLTFVIDRQGRIASVGGASYPDASASATHSLSAEQAIRAAASALGLDDDRSLRLISSSNGPSKHTVFRNSLSDGLYRPLPISADLVTFPLGDAQARLGWKTTIESQLGLYQTIVDANSGDVLFRHSLTYFAGPEGNVYTSQNPTTTQQIVPFTGWVSGRTTSGNNVNAYLDLNASNAIGYQPQTPDTGDPAYQHFDYAFTNAYQTSGGTNITTDRDATLTQLFYWVNLAHDYYYALGFTEPSRNFQTDNFGRGGAGGDAVLAEAFNGWGTGTEKLCKDSSNNDILCRNNANFNSGPGDGTPGRLEVYLGSTPFPFRESEMEGDTIVHEYGHGVSNRLVGGGNLGSGVQTGGLGEGWSDFFAISYFNDPVIFEYSGGGDANTPPTSGFRRISSYATSTEKYTLLCNPSCEVHNDGEIWATALWNLRVKLGQAKSEKLVIDGMKGTATNPSFLAARDAILTADQTDYSGADKCTIWGVFAASEMGKSATSSSDQKTVAAGTDGPAECTPVANIGGPYSVGEGASVPLDASGTTENGDGPFTYAWDLDNDGQYDNATGKAPAGVAFGQDGTYPVKVKVTNANGFSSVASIDVTVTNVLPTVTTLTTDSPKIENSLVTANVVVTDPGWLDTPTATIDWGDGASSLSGTVENVRPDATLTASSTHTYGDNGTFTLTICPSDEAAGPCRATSISITNAIPTAAIDKSSATTVNGVATFLAHAGQPVPFSGRSTDSGSDDLLLDWKWADSTPDATPKYLNDAINFPLGDPFPSPSINPRDLTDSRTHTFGDACFYTVDFSVLDDDNGPSPTDHVAVIITGNATARQGAGYWQTQYRPRPTAFPEKQRTCFLQIAGFMSSVFDETTDASTVAKAFDVLFVGGNNGSAKQQLDRQLLTSWLNFANGALDLSTLVDTNKDKVPDMAFSTVISNAETIRLSSSSTATQLRAQKDLLEAING